MSVYRKINKGNVSDRNVSAMQSWEAQNMADNRLPQMSGRLIDIWTAFAIVTIPMLTFSAVLLRLVYSYRVRHSANIDERLQSPATRDEPGVYYVNLSATVLIFISSWSSSLGPLLLSFLMTLASYPLARHYWLDVREQKPSLPTPFQFALSLKFISGGGWGALYNWMRYLVGWRKQRQFQSTLLTESAFATVVITMLSLIVFLADTWLHITTSTVSFVNATPVTNIANYSLNLIPGCLGSNNSAAVHPVECSLITSSTGIFLFNPSQALTVLNNVSDSIAVYNSGPDSTYTYLGIPVSKDTTGHDYSATTFGMKTQCKQAARQCSLHADSGASTPFQCTSAFFGNLQVDTWLPAYFADAAMVSNETRYGVQNPYYHAVGAGFQTVNNPNLETSDETVVPVHGGIAFLLSCSVEMYDIEYDSINGTVTRFVAKPSNVSVANAWQVPIEASGVAESNLQTAALIAATTATSAQDLADQYALSYSKTALGLGAQSVQLAPALAVQERSSLLVTRLPMAPLFSLIAANLAFVLLGIALTYGALTTSGGGIRDVQARLSIAGLVADRFERSSVSNPAGSIDELFAEHSGSSSSVVALEQTPSGGFAYREWLKIIDST
ncbi:hypothetical protein HD806DRAFT_546754 [Xylariaceae sp. AK1471]|nr:hypothetical protein HD806DRAFT_546754 [Xylariaceae sp. AK1471]